MIAPLAPESEKERAARQALDEALDKRFAKLDERMAARVSDLVVRFGTLGESIDRMSAAGLEATRMSEQGPIERHRMNLASMCYGIRLRAACDAPESLAMSGMEQTPMVHRVLARLAVHDADALIAALAAPKVP